jgi:CRISP-associated protein Cas1
MAALYLVEQGVTLRKEHARFVVEAPQSKVKGGDPDLEAAVLVPLQVPIQEVDQVLVFGNIHLSTAAISACLAGQVPVVFLSQSGHYKGHLWSAERGNLAVEAAQFDRRHEETFQLEMARSLVWGKLMNSRQLLLRLHRKRRVAGVEGAIAGIGRDIAAVEQAGQVESLRGYEGAAAARYFPALGQLLTNPGFSLTERSRRPPRDAMNSLLSFGYSLLFNNVLGLLLAEGVNPYLGNLHRSDRNEPHLAFDLMEEFRSPIVDSLVMTLVNQQVLKPEDFRAVEDGGIYLTDAARRLFLRRFEERMGEAVSHPSVQAQVTYRRAIQLQIQRYQRCLLEGMGYESFLRAV